MLKVYEHLVTNTGGFVTLHVRDKYFGGFAVNSKSGFDSNEKVEIHILDTILDMIFTILGYLTIFYKMNVSTKIKYFKLKNSQEIP